MKKSLLVLSAFAMLVASSASADFYGSVAAGAVVGGDYTFSGGPDDGKDNADIGYAYSLAVGYQLPVAGIRGELEYLRMESDMKDNGAERMINQGIMLNGYLPLPLPAIKPYVGLGIGMMETSDFVEADSVTYGSEQNFAYQAMLGVELEVPVIKSIGIEARYFHNEADIETTTVESDIFSIMLKARF